MTVFVNSLKFHITWKKVNIAYFQRNSQHCLVNDRINQSLWLLLAIFEWFWSKIDFDHHIDMWMPGLCEDIYVLLCCSVLFLIEPNRTFARHNNELPSKAKWLPKSLITHHSFFPISVCRKAGPSAEFLTALHNDVDVVILWFCEVVRRV